MNSFLLQVSWEKFAEDDVSLKDYCSTTYYGCSRVETWFLNADVSISNPKLTEQQLIPLSEDELEK